MNNEQKLKHLLKEMGVDNYEELIKADESAISSFAKGINKNLGIGKKAANMLAQLQNRDPVAEIKAMGLDIESLKKNYETVSDFGETMPAFVNAKALADQELKSQDMSVIELKAGQEVCMTAGMYQAHIMQNPSIAPSERLFADIYKPYRGASLDGKTLFVWRSGGIGDLLFIRPVLMAIKDKYPTVEIIFGTRNKYHSLIEQWDDCIDSFTSVPFITSETLDVADYHISYEGLIERCKDAELMDVHDLFAMHSHVEVADYNRPMKAVCKNKVFDILPKGYAVMQIGASSPIRTPLFGSLVPVANHITKSRPLVISGSRNESRIIQDFISCCEHPDKIMDHYPKAIDAHFNNKGGRTCNQH